ncbi:hypothetical protein K504DRAFT_506813 [Pleomassaria siparia CBS 279.74]|uniref:Uncharacterized protein n=1 Tax=Pleomassaria siparia CBS 279.74 TaxID=1314801 RepID=A0A6G1JXA6_9PLEO|nr:hypothetical protein K504DRAFT_506813 [Pleomassaria siparia CBS 279.74]
MGSHGRIFSLLDKRYLEQVSDITGNALPIPTLLPYNEYPFPILVYKMDTDPSLFLALMQDFTDRTSRELDTELWAWVMQWEVSNPPNTKVSGTGNTPAFKRLRTDVPSPNPPPIPSLPEQTPPPVLSVTRRYLNDQLLVEDDMMRILFDIVAIESSLVPNFMEFLYQWVDYYEGDGKALQAAVRREIPSLWDFECHPRELSTTTNKGGEKMPAVRAKPDLAAFEKLVRDSERRQYGEVRFGLRPDKEEPTIAPLLNIPTDHFKRLKYYSACFKNRRHAIGILSEAGITPKQINNYKMLQPMPPKETSEEGIGDCLKHYHKEMTMAKSYCEMKEEMDSTQGRSQEILISHQLARDAFQAARDATTEAALQVPQFGNQPVLAPLIPATPVYNAHRENQATQRQVASARAANDAAIVEREEHIEWVPAHMWGRFKASVVNNVRVSFSRRYGEVEQALFDVSDDFDDDTDDDDAIRANAGTAAVLPTATERPGPITPLNIDNVLRNMNVQQLNTVMARYNPAGRHEILRRMRMLYQVNELQPGVAPVMFQHIVALAQGVPGPRNTADGTGMAVQGQQPRLVVGGGAAAHALPSINVTPASPNPIWQQPNQGAQVQQHQNMPNPRLGAPRPSPNQQRSTFTPINSQPGFSAPLPGLQRKAPPQLLLRKERVPVQVYFQRIVRYVGSFTEEPSDATLLGWLTPSTGAIELTHAILLPVSAFSNYIRRVATGKYEVIESYPTPHGVHFGGSDTPHRTSYQLLKQAYTIMSSCSNREAELTKRWRATQGSMVHNNFRGSVWEGYAATLDKPLQLTCADRQGAFMFKRTNGDVACIPWEEKEKERAKVLQELAIIEAEEEAEEEAREAMEAAARIAMTM